jgi:hypothetical protein
VYICDVCVLVCFHSKLVFRIKGCGEIGCQFIVNFHNIRRVEEEHAVSLRPGHLAPSRMAVSHRPLGPDPSLAVHRLVLGTHTAEGSPNFLMVADALLPIEASQASVDGNPENPIVTKVSFWHFHSFSRKILWYVVFSWIVLWMFGIYFDEFFSGYQVVVKISRRMCLIYIFSVLIGRDERQDTYIVVIKNCLVVNIWKIF